jgi:DNA-binding NarL/FixJ family response regulator
VLWREVKAIAGRPASGSTTCVGSLPEASRIFSPAASAHGTDTTPQLPARIEFLYPTGRFEVVGRASNGDEAFELAARFRPDIVTMDLQMPVRDGVEATRMITAYFPATAVVIVSASPWLLDEALAAGAVAHVPKEDVSDQLFDVLRAIAERAPLLR